jgi:phospholipid/cholesterol/gamma-HCH transport system substrate-binding protein
MNQPANDFKLGLFTIGGLALLATGLVAFGVRTYFVHASVFETYVAGDVTGLAIGSPVELRGVRVGKVRSVNFSWAEYVETQPSYIVVEFDMRDDVTPLPPGSARSEMLQSAIERGLRARLKSQGITGTSMLSIEYLNPAENPPAQFPWKPKHTYIPSAPGQLSELLGSIEKTLRNVERLDFGAINQLLQTDLKSVGTLLDHAKQVEFGAISTNANSLLTELRGSNTNLQSFIVNADGTVKRMKLEKLAHDLDGLVAELQSTVEGLRPGLANIDFDGLNQTLANAHRALGDLDDALTELKQYPSGFLFGNPPSRVTEVQPPLTK